MEALASSSPTPAASANSSPRPLPCHSRVETSQRAPRRVTASRLRAGGAEVGARVGPNPTGFSPNDRMSTRSRRRRPPVGRRRARARAARAEPAAPRVGAIAARAGARADARAAAPEPVPPAQPAPTAAAEAHATAAAEAHATAAAEELELVRAENPTGFKYVSFDSRQNHASKPFKAELRDGGRHKYLGTFATPEEAALAVARALGPGGRRAVSRRPTPQPTMTAAEAHATAAAEGLELVRRRECDGLQKREPED